MNKAELKKLAAECGIGWAEGLGGMDDFLEKFAEAVLRAAPRQEEQEPVAAIHIGWDYLGSRKLAAIYAVPVPRYIAPRLYAAPQPAPLSDDAVQKTWALLDELEKLRSADRYDEDWYTLNKRDDDLRAALGARED